MEKIVNKSKTYKIVLTSFFLCVAFIFQLIEIPIYSFLSIDATLGILILSTLYLPNYNVLVIAILAPLATFFGIGGGDLVGFLILETVYTSFILSYLFLNKYSLQGFFKILISSFVSLLVIWVMNLILFYPAYFGFDYSMLYSSTNFLSYLKMVSVFTIVSSISRFIFSFFIFFLLKKTLKKQ